jgi:hypothetical protein
VDIEGGGVDKPAAAAGPPPRPPAAGCGGAIATPRCVGVMSTSTLAKTVLISRRTTSTWRRASA